MYEELKFNKSQTQKTVPQIHIALSPWNLTDDYNRHVGVTLISALEHCSLPVTVHLLYDKKLSLGKEDEEAYNKTCYQKISERYNCKIEYHHTELPSWVEEIPAIKIWTPGTLLRLCLPELLTEIDKVIYLDCDTVVLTDLARLWELSLGDAFLAACPDSMSPSFEKKRRNDLKRMGIDFNKYFCAGVLVMNLSKLRDAESSFSDTAFTYLHENQNLQFLDQDLLNWYCKGNYLPLGENMNIYTIRDDAMDYTKDCILHYATRESKPWNKYSGPIDDYYWKYCVETPWCNNQKDLIKYIRHAPDTNRCLVLFSNNFLSNINGTKLEKIKITANLIVNISKSTISWIWRFVKKPLVCLGILYNN